MAEAENALKVAVLEERLDGHEKVCADRYGDIKDAFSGVNSRLDKIMYGLIGLLLAMLAWVVANGRLPWVD